MSHHLRETLNPCVPLSSRELLTLYRKHKEELDLEANCPLSQDEIRSITNNLKPADFTRGYGFVLSSDEAVSMVAWMINKKECRQRFSRFVMDDPWKWKDTVGEIRDQMFHLLCWGYVATDLVSALMKRHVFKQRQFVPLSVWHLCAYCKPSCLLPKMRRDGIHHCYGLTAENGIIHIQFCGGHEEIGVQFDCKDHKPPLTDPPLVKIGMVQPRRIDTLDKALQELKHRPVGADLLLYCSAFVQFSKPVVYYGPKQSHTRFLSYHAVTMLGVTVLDGEHVVICKLSNGFDAGHKGYLYVSLATLYIPVGVNEDSKKDVRGSSTPLHLLTNFVVPEFIMNDDKKHDDKRQRHDDEKEDKKKKDEKEEDNRKTKRPRLSKPTTGRYGSSSSSSSRRTGTHQRRRSLHPEEEEEEEELNLKEESWVSIPNQTLKTLQTIREITGEQHSDEDPNETAQKLLSLDTFHEVKNKRDKKKENVIQVTQGSSRNGGRNFPNQGYGRNASFRENHVAGRFRPSRPVSNRGRNFVGPRANRVSGPSGVGNGKAQVDVAVSVEKGLVEEHPPAKSSFASVISAEPVAKALEPVNVPEPNKLQPFTFGRQDTWEQVTENGNASNEVKDQSVLKADVGELSNVTFPFHIQAAKKLQNGLTFGSFASDFVKEVKVKINGKKRISRGVSKDSQSPKTRQDEKGMRQNDCKEKKKSG